MIKLLICIIVLVLLIINLYKESFENKPFSNKPISNKPISNKPISNKPCSNNLSDIDYLKHMIPHHQVAVDISVLLQKKSKNPLMQHILRKIIWVQNYEINMMKEILKNPPTNDMSIDTLKMNKKYISTVSDFTKPNKLGLTDTYCDLNFFNPEEHMKHIKHMKLDDMMYIKHMIPHHQVAVDMSKKLLKNTNNDFMIYLVYRIIRSQQEEIILLNDLLKTGNYRHESNILY